MVTTMVFQQAKGISQLFIKRHKGGTIAMSLAKDSGDIFYFLETLRQCTTLLKLTNKFLVGKPIIDSKIDFNGSIIIQYMEGNIYMNMDQYIQCIKELDLIRQRRKEVACKAKDYE